MQDQIKNLPKKYFQITDENKRDRMVAYVRLDEVLEIVNDTYTYHHQEKVELYYIPGKNNQCYFANGILMCRCGECMQESYPLPEDFNVLNKNTLTYSEVTYNDIVPGTARLSEDALERAQELENNQE